MATMYEPHEVPMLTVPQEEIFKAAISMRMMAGSLARLREQHGVAAFESNESAGRKADAARLNSLRWFTNRDVTDWDQAQEARRVFADRHAESGMTVRVAPLSGGRFGLQAGWPDNHVDVVTESREATQNMHRWLFEEPTPERISGVRDWLSGRHQETLRAAEVAKAHAWAAEHDPDWYSAWNVAHTMSPADTQVRAESVLVNRMTAHLDAEKQEAITSGGNALRESADREWADFMAGLSDDALATHDGWAVPYGPDTPLTDRLQSRVPDSILNNARWPKVEDRFRELVDAGADPAMLSNTLADLDWDNARSPSGYAVWALDDADNRVREERKMLAGEWLLNTDPDDPRHRAEAAEMLGQIDNDFDAQLGRRFPGLLDPTATMLEQRARNELADADATDARVDHLNAEPDIDRSDVLASLAQQAMAWHSSDTDDIEEPVANLWTELSAFAYPDEDDQLEAQLRGAAADERTAADEDLAKADAFDSTVVTAAQTPLTAPKRSPSRGSDRRAPRKAAAPAAQRHQSVHRGRGR
ncbi:MAG: hypothetical protein DI630_30865 [Gordonia sp. (in: high G+C Gram-positive bacteria)]|nr:MAG: hypothetical protein DI630_30865 [Gordonia sp. (in: high G+C Gram-positive bacteria)]